MDDNSIPLAPWAQAPQQNSDIPLAPWSPPQKPNQQVSVPPGSAQDPDPMTRFYNSFGSAAAGIAGAAKDALTVHSHAEKMAQVQHAMDLMDRMDKGDEDAKNEIISALPFGSTVVKLRKGDIAGALGDIGGAVALGGIAKGAGLALDSDLAQSGIAGLRAGGGDVAAGTAKIAGGAGVAGGAHALGLGPFGEYMLGKPLIVKGMKQVGKGVRNAIDEGKTRYSLLKDPGDVEFPNPSAQEQGAFLKPGEEGFQMKSPAPARQLTNQSQLDLRPNDVEISDEPFELSGGQFPTRTPTQPKLKVESPVDTSKVPVKPISYKDSQNPDVAKNLQVGTKRTMPDGSTQVLQSVPIDDISGDPGNQITGRIVDEYQKNGYTVHPELREGGETKYTINEGHHRILADVKNGKTNITTWVPAVADK